MQSSIQSVLIKILKGIIVLLIIVYLFQVTFAERISFNNFIIDNFFYFASYFSLITIALFSSVLMFLITKNRWLRISSFIVTIPFGFMLFILLLFTVPTVLTDFPKYYFFKKDGYHYYVTSERVFGFEGSRNLKFYKDKKLVLFLKERLRVSESELILNSIDPNKQSSKLWELYSR